MGTRLCLGEHDWRRKQFKAVQGSPRLHKSVANCTENEASSWLPRKLRYHSARIKFTLLKQSTLQRAPFEMTPKAPSNGTQEDKARLPSTSSGS